MKKGDIVKYRKPEAGEESARFILLDDETEARAHALKCGLSARVDIQLIGDEYIKPIETVELSEICPAEAGRWFVRNTLAERSRIIVPANSAREAVAFARTVLPHDSNWVAERELTPAEVAEFQTLFS